MHVWLDQEIWTTDDLATKGAVDLESPSFKAIQRIATLCNRAAFSNDPANMALPVNERAVIGDASETALLKFCEPIDSVLPVGSPHF